MSFNTVVNTITPKLSKKALLILFFFSILSASQKFKIESFNSIESNNQWIKEESFNQSKRLNLLEKMPAFGFRNYVSNYNFLQFLQYFGDEQSRKIAGYGLSPNYLAVSIKHDPHYIGFYLFLAESTTFYAGMPERTVELMNEGLSHLEPNKPSDSYYVWRYKGIDELLFLDKGKAAQKSFEMAANWAKESDAEDSDLISSLSAQTAEFLSSNPASNQAKINSWGSILTTTFDEETRKRAIRSIRALGGDVLVGEDGRVSVKYSSIDKKSQPVAKSDI